MSKWKKYEFRLTKQSIYSNELLPMPHGSVVAYSVPHAKALVKEESRRAELHLSASMIVKIEMKIGSEWVEI